jgi:predicted glycosyltransferase involved in capsule biosynthesis
LSGLNISLTISEHSFNPEHSQFCKKNKINYIWIKSEEPFNKCLAMNVAALYSSTAKYLLFHDIDCLMQKDFFINLMLNINSKNCKAIQCFHGRRVLYLDQEVTENVLSKKTCVDELAFGNKCISPPQVFGAPGGSICIETNLFFEVGGYDPELFNSNAPEDVFFWNKVGELDEMQTCDSPNIDLFHLNHPVTYYDNPRIQEMQHLNRSFFTATPEQKKEFIEFNL